MLRHQIDQRPNWMERVADCGVDPGDLPSSWHEGHCYEISTHQADAVHQLTDQLYRLMADATDQIIDDGTLVDFWGDASLASAIISSWNDADYYPTLLSRFDFEWRGADQFQLINMSLISPSMLLESAVAQWRWLTERIPWATQYNHIQERLISLWRDYRYTGRSVHFSYPDRSYETFLVAEYLEDLAREAGVHSHLIPTSALRYDTAKNAFFDNRDLPVERLILTGEESHLGCLPITEAYQLDSLCIAEPLWKKLWTHPQWFSQLKRMYPHEPLLHLVGHERHRYPSVICSSWIVAGAACGIGISEQIAAGTRRFIPHLLDTSSDLASREYPPGGRL